MKTGIHEAIRQLVGPPDKFVARFGKDGRFLRGIKRVSTDREEAYIRYLSNPKLIREEGGAYGPKPKQPKQLSATQSRFIVKRIRNEASA